MRGARRAWLLIALAACGRVDFVSEPPRDAQNTDANPDADACEMSIGLAGHWSLDSADVVGNTIVDRSGRGQHGTLVGTPPPVVGTGHVGDALDFTATTVAYAELATVALDTTMGGSNTISLWFYNDDPNVDDALFYMPEAPGAGPPRYDLWLNYSRISMVTLCINGGVSDCWGVSDPGLLGRWVHVVAVMVNGRTDQGRIYIDGVDRNASCRFGVCTEIRSAELPFRLGGSDPNYPWNGKLDDVRIYDRALAPGEIQQLHACAP
jgi:hypothetical protein